MVEIKVERNGGGVIYISLVEENLTHLEIYCRSDGLAAKEAIDVLSPIVYSLFQRKASKLIELANRMAGGIATEYRNE